MFLRVIYDMLLISLLVICAEPYALININYDNILLLLIELFRQNHDICVNTNLV